MRKLILSMQVSLDGFIEGENGDISWIKKDDDEQWKDLFEMLDSVDLFLLGSVMFPDYRNYWKKCLTDPAASANEMAYARLAEKTPHIVFSQTLKDPDWHNTEIFSGPVAAEVRKLKEMPGRDIQVVGGAKLAATLINAGLIDEYRLLVNPFIITKGKSFLQQVSNKHSLELIETKTFKTGVVRLRYKKSG